MTLVLPPPPARVTALQFITALAAPPAAYMPGGAATPYITEAEAEAWISRTALPATALAAIATLPQGDQFPARLAALGMTEVLLSSPLLTAALALVAATPAERLARRDALMRFAATLFTD